MKYTSIRFIGFLLLMLGTSVLAAASSIEELRARSAKFNQEIIKVNNKVYTAVGYGVAPISMIVARKGLIIVNGGIDPDESRKVREAFRKISKKPVVAVILTSSDRDHTGGVNAFLDDASTQIWAHESFGKHRQFAQTGGISIDSKRRAQANGAHLPDYLRINNGISKAFQKGTSRRTMQMIVPTNTLNSTEEVKIAGTKLQLIPSPGPGPDHLMVYLPAKDVMFTGDVFYQTWPDLAPLAGEPYRDIRSWTISLNQIANIQPKYLVAGRMRPLEGQEEIFAIVSNYRDAIYYVFDQTIKGINLGLTPDQLVAAIKIPEQYQQLDYLKPYYGHWQWAVRSIYHGYLGWFDGNPSSLFALTPKEEAQRWADLLGGESEIIYALKNAQKDSDFQWAAQLADVVLALDPGNSQAMTIKAQALTLLAGETINAQVRNYYLSQAAQLRKQASTRRPPPTLDATPEPLNETQ